MRRWCLYRGVLLVGLLVSLSLPPAIMAAPFQVKVAATIVPLHDLVRQVAGARVDVVGLVPPGASPHTVAFKPSMMRALNGSRLLFAIGYGLDDWAVRLAADVGVSQVVYSHGDEGLPTALQATHDHADADGHHQKHEEKHGVRQGGNIDPHYWLSIPNAMHMVTVIATALARLDPDGQGGYGERAQALLDAMRAADRDIRAQLAAVPRREIAVFHAGFAYFAAAYDVRIIATFEPAPGREPGAAAREGVSPPHPRAPTAHAVYRTPTRCWALAGFGPRYGGDADPARPIGRGCGTRGLPRDDAF